MDDEQITRCVLQIDADFCKNVRVREHGSTCTFCVTQPQKGRPGYYDVMAVNVGDSRSMLIHPDGSIQPLTEDHKPENPVEEARIRAAGGVVQMNRVDGQLAMSRAIGDWLYKSNPNLTPELQKVIAVPQITRAVAAPGDVLLICCDGIVEQMTSAEAGKCVRDTLKSQMEEKKVEDLAVACYDLNMTSLARNSKDNHSAMVIAFDDGTAYQREDEFIAGPFHPYKDSQAFVEAYIADAKKHGVEGERLFELARKAEATMPPIPASPAPPRQMPIAALQQIMTSQPGGAREVLAMLGSMLASASLQEDPQGENE
jgi:serine/threonine protein phosphatase PrpC